MSKTMSMKELPESEKPYEKCLKQGPAYLSDAELIAVIIRTGSQREQALDLARNILKLSPGGILNLEYLSIKQLTSLHGMGVVKAVQLKCVAEISKRIARTNRQRAYVFRDAGEIASYYMEQMRHLTKEHLLLAMFDADAKLLGDEVLSIGTVTSSLVSAREVFMKAMEHKAVYIILLHNHPSGNPNPSEEDISVTKKINESGKLLDIPLLDHIIIGDNRYFSFAECSVL